uniref:Uncharacterized protein n=1 Tax=Arundo donax TaxID=35708 RepID=A0A0A9BLZ3_ARUDO
MATRYGVWGSMKETLLRAHLIRPSILFWVLRRRMNRSARGGGGTACAGCATVATLWRNRYMVSFQAGPEGGVVGGGRRGLERPP